MKRYAMILALPLFAAGCANEPAPATPAPTSTAAAPTATVPAQPSASVSTAKPANATPTAAAIPAPKAYFEVKKDGKTYVFGSYASMKKFNDGDASGIKWTPQTGPNGESVALESDGATLDQSLWGEYTKSHPKK